MAGALRNHDANRFAPGNPRNQRRHVPAVRHTLAHGMIVTIAIVASTKARRLGMPRAHRLST
jgi:hypothetical protein